MKCKGYILDKVFLNIGGSSASIEDVKLVAQPFQNKEKNF
jgi:hypothetical protein